MNSLDTYKEYRELEIAKVLRSLELGAATPAECYEFAGRFRREFLEGYHCLVGDLAWQLVMRTNRQGRHRPPEWRSLKWLETYLRMVLQTEEQEHF